MSDEDLLARDDGARILLGELHGELRHVRRSFDEAREDLRALRKESEVQARRLFALENLSGTVTTLETIVRQHENAILLRQGALDAAREAAVSRRRFWGFLVALTGTLTALTKLWPWIVSVLHGSGGPPPTIGSPPGD